MGRKPGLVNIYAGPVGCCYDRRHVPAELVRSRQEVLLNADNQSEEAIASADPGLIWTTLPNIVPSSVMCALHMFQDTDLRDRVRSSLAGAVNETAWHINMEQVLHKSLLSSVYTETFGLHTQVSVTRCSPHSDVELVSWMQPKNRVCMVSKYTSHMDESFWNTRNGTFPVESFSAERLLIDPKDLRSGPVRDDVPPSILQKASNTTRLGLTTKDPFIQSTLLGYPMVVAAMQHVLVGTWLNA
ncbi:hypothetical protein F5Y06DRAFT_47427 [Hypoxylon sp. FL0890]|nr:hypothetical protein F5Y06DRAFT_47427 [Hypoxylon sp. FL0890]